MLSSISLLTTLLLSMSYHSATAQNTTSSGASGSASASGAAGASSITSLAAALSTSCQTSAGSLITSEFGSCANIIGLASVIGGTGSIVPPLNNWITSICAADPCSNSTLSSAKQSISTGCSSDIQKGSPVAAGLNTIIGNYDTIRSLLCTQYVSNSTFCVPSILGNIQTATGTNLTLTEITGLLSNGMTASTFSKVPAGTYCNDCGHALATLSAPLTAAMSASMSSGNTTGMTMNHSSSASLGGVCGASFNDGKIPSGVKIAAKGASTAASNAQNSAGIRESASFPTVAFATLASSLIYLVC